MTLSSDTRPAPARRPADRRPAAATGGAPVTAVVVDPHAAVREGLARLLSAEGVDVVATSQCCDGGAALVERHAPDVALIAGRLPDGDGIALVRRLAAGATRTAAVLYADDDEPERSALAVRAGAAGVVATRRSIPDLAVALRAVAAGRMWFDEPAERHARPQPPAPPPAAAPGRRTGILSESELRVLELVACGSSTEAIADRLSLSPHTVRTHLRNMMRKLQASSRAHAVAIALREAAIEL